MAEILNNKEIDELLAAFRETGLEEAETPQIEEGEDREVRKFDFTRPRRFRRNQFAVLQGIHEESASRLRVALSEGVKLAAAVELLGCEQLRFESFLAGLPERPLVYAIGVQQFDAPTLLSLDHDLLFTGVDRLLGGPGRTAMPAREPTALEDAVGQSFVAKTVLGFTTSWATTPVKLVFQVRQRLAGPALLGVMDPKEVGFAATYQVKGAFPSGELKIFLPYRGLQPYLDRLAPESQGLVDPGVRSEIVQRAVLPVRVRLQAVLGSARLPLREVLGLEPGDIVPLERHVNEPIDVLVGTNVKFRARLGTHGKKLAVRILSVTAPHEVQALEAGS
ncbi:MAG: FliM/FliN family flagellar motor switch protein [Planctomycetota bacterium]